MRATQALTLCLILPLLAACAGPVALPAMPAALRLPGAQPQIDVDATRAQLLRALAEVPATTIVAERSDPLILEPMVMLEREGERLHFQATSGRRLSLRGGFIAGLHGFGVDLIDVTYESAPAIAENQPEAVRQLVSVASEGGVLRETVSCRMGELIPKGQGDILRLTETCRFGQVSRENWYDLATPEGPIIASRQWVARDVAVTFTVAMPSF